MTLRAIRTFDFEERDRGNVEDLPAGWMKVEGPGLPRFVNGTFDESVRANGRTSFRVDLNGGSAIYRYPAGLIPVTPGAVCRVSANVRTTPLNGARARVAAYFADVDGRPIESSRRASAPASNVRGDVSFHAVDFDLVADDRAASIVLEIALLQPSLLFDAAEPAGRPLFVEDIRGSAWFDDVRVAQVPQVDLSTDQPSNVFYRDESIVLHVRVRDTIVDDLTTELRLVDADGRGVFQRTGSLALVGARTPGDVRGSIPLPPVPPGWYRATLVVRSQGETIGEHALSFVRLVDPPGPTRRDPRFGLVATSLAPAAWPLLPDLCDRLSAGRVKLAVWSSTFGAESDPAGTLDRVLDRLNRRNVVITPCLVAPSPAMQNAIGGSAWTELLKVDRSRWEPQLAYLLARFGTNLTQWQFADDADADRMARDGDYRAVYDRLAGSLQQLTGSRDLLMPWPAWFDVDARQAPGAIALAIPPAVLPEQIGLYVDEMRAAKGRGVSLTLAPIDRDRYGRAAQERDLALRIVSAVAANADRIDLPMPAAAQADGGRVDPTPLLPVQRTMVQALSGARFVGRASLGADVDGFCFAVDGRGLMFVSRRGDAAAIDASTRAIDLTLGRDAARLDLTGVASPLRRSSQRGHADDVTLDVGPMPFFVTDVDLPLVMLRASLSLDRPVLESSNQSHVRTLRFKNDFEGPIAGSIRLIAPPGWTVSLAQGTFALNPGETFAAPVTITFPANVPAGPTALLADLRIEGRDDRRLLLPVPLSVGLEDVGLQSFAVRVGDEVVVQQVITNYGTTPIDYTAFVSMPGRPRQERIVSELAPGRSTVRRYRFAAPAADVKACRSGLKELQGKRMLNAEVTID